MSIQRLCIVGTGLIGGSLARALREAGECAEFVGFGRDKKHLQTAQDLGVIDRYSTDLATAVEGAEVVVLCVPVGAMDTMLEQLALCVVEDTIITDVGSVKTSVMQSAVNHLGESSARFVPCHPITGAETSGVATSRADLFRGRRVIMTPNDATSATAFGTVRAMWEAVDAEVTVMDAALHDEVLAATSHLPHVLAYTLVDALVRMDEHEDIFRYAAGGFADFTRIAASDPQMWHDICIANRDALLDVMAGFQRDLDELSTAIRATDSARILAIFSRAKAARDALND